MERHAIDNAGGPGPDLLERTAAILREGGLAVLPTDTIYGLHASASSEAAVRRIFAAKRRSSSAPLVVLCSDRGQFASLGIAAAEDLLDALETLWPAPFTAVLPLSRPIAPSAGRETIGVRIPALAWMRELVARSGPIASTSVNVSGERAVYSTEEIPVELIDSVDILLDAGPLAARASTVIDFTAAVPAVLREGDFRFTQNLWKSLRKTL